MNAFIPLAIVLLGIGADAGPVDGVLAIMTIEQADSSRASVVITREPLRPGRINPFQYGQFVEYLCNLVPAMWAEKLFDGSFEGLTPYKFAYIKETDFRERPWYPSGATNRAVHVRDRSTRISGEVCLKIAASDIVPCHGGRRARRNRGRARVGLQLHLLLQAERPEGAGASAAAP